MTRRAIIITPAMLGVGFGIVAACQTRREVPKSETTVRPSAPVAVATGAESRPVAHIWEAHGVRVTCPAGWQEKKDPDFELYLIPPGAKFSGTDEDARITFDVPDLPPHLPWMIQMSRIHHDYEADLKKVHPDLKEDEATDVKIADATARLVKSSWHQNGVAYEDVALLMIHASGVYILDARAGDKRLAETKAAFEGMRDSMQWTK